MNANICEENDKATMKSSMMIEGEILYLDLIFKI